MHKQITIKDLTFEPLITEEAVQERVRELGQALLPRYRNLNPLFISILSGAFVFASDLIRAFDADCEVGFVKISSYSGTQSTGNVQTVMGLEKDLSGRHIIVVEDIIDTGRTLHFFLDHLQAQSPASIEVVAFLRKPEAVQFDIETEYVGFDIENRFVVGYGLDYDALGRNLPGIYQLKED